MSTGTRRGPLAGFRVAGKAVTFDFAPRAVREATVWLELLPFKELVSTETLANSLGMDRHWFWHYSAHPQLAPYRHTPRGRGAYWGSKRTIAELKKQLKGGK